MNVNNSYTNEMIRIRRDLHSYPETGWNEFRTTALIIQQLRAFGFDVRFGTEIIRPDAVMGRDPQEAAAAMARAIAEGTDPAILESMGGYTGALGILDTGRPGPTTAFRFDIDALCVTETDSPTHIPNQKGFASKRKGIMHACGHDCHTAVGLALAHWASDHQEQLCGRLKLIFQPAEEGTRGALPMAEAGILDDCNYLIASHIACKPRLGEIMITDPGYSATIKFDVEFEGRAAHPVRNPQDGRNALHAACHAITAIGNLPKHGAGMTAACCGRLVAGEARNVVPSHARLEMEVRGATNELCLYIYDQVHRVLEHCAGMFDVRLFVKKVGQAFTMTPTPELSRILEECSTAVVGAGKVFHYSVKGGSEDASILMDRVQKHGGSAAHFVYGADSDPNHTSTFDPDDEKSMPIGFTVMTLALERLNSRPTS